MRTPLSCDLLRHIAKDLYQNGKTVLILLFLLLFTTTKIVALTYTTRELIKEKSHLTLQTQTLEHEAINLILEETTLMDKSRISHIARRRLQMKPVEHSQEILVAE